MRISVLCPCTPPRKIHTLGICFIQVLSSHSFKLERTPAAGIRNGCRRQLLGNPVVAIRGRSSLSSKPTLALTAAFDDSAASDPIEFVFALSLTTMLSNIVVHPCVFSCPNSSGSTLFLHFSGKGVSASVSATVAALEDAHIDADFFETICQIR